MIAPLQLTDVVSERARTYIHTRWRDTGSHWLAGITGRVERLLVEWDLELVQAMNGGRSCVLAVRTRAGTDAVLKVEVLERWAVREAIALRHWSAKGHAARVHAADGDALLVERLEGRPLTPLDWDEVGNVAGMLAAASRDAMAPPGIPRIDPQRSIAAAAARTGHRLPARWAWKVQERAAALAGTGPMVLCHADLVPANVFLSVDGRVRLIDPEPRLAPLSYDLALFAYRFAEGAHFAELASEVARAAGVPDAEVLGWGVVHAYAHSAWRQPHEQSPHALELLGTLSRR